MEAYNVKAGTKVIIQDDDIKIAPSSIPVNNGDEVTIFTTDGMYCNGSNADGDRIYITAWTNVEPIK